ncbi:MAG TPA: CoB--CoM heterodisulfide reductase iron-sulfur subunit A family protein [Methanoregulaceae archaeon]|nr:CoB--CoM heterodisulfide reductase iron-sulfur subunit A family protein [Methanoregulaceae archaeon]
MDSVLIIGAGVTGIQAALDLADHGITVYLIEREPSIGGHMSQLDKTFPTNDCSMCILSPKMVDVYRHPNIRVYTCTEIEKVAGSKGNFTVTLKKKPRYVVEELCNGCGDCIEICPVEVYNEFDAGMGVRKAIYKPHPQAVPDIVIRDPDHCIECGLCYDACLPGAVKKEDSPVTTEIQAGSIIIATGYQIFDPKKKGQFHYLDFPDVITSLELERMINASGPTGGQLRRLTDGREPRAIVFIQCVGSRDMQLDRPWCSCVCCMASIKNAILIKEKHPETSVTICYMDVRAYGKGYEEYRLRAEQAGIRFLRGIPGEIGGMPDSMVLVVEDSETQKVEELHPDFVVLAVGLGPSGQSAELAEKLGISLDRTGFFKPLDEKVGMVETNRPGIYIAGTAVAPKDIPDCVAIAGAAAMKAFIGSIRE